MPDPRERETERDDWDEGPDDAFEPVYPDGSVKHECWHDRERREEDACF